MATGQKYYGSPVLTPFVKTATGKIAKNERVVHADTTLGGMTLTLPAAACVEGFFSVVFKVDGGDLVVQSPEPTPVVNLTFADAADRLLVYSDGVDQWYVVTNSGGS